MTTERQDDDTTISFSAEASDVGIPILVEFLKKGYNGEVTISLGDYVMVAKFHPFGVNLNDEEGGRWGTVKGLLHVGSSDVPEDFWDTTEAGTYQGAGAYVATLPIGYHERRAHITGLHVY